MPLIQLTGKIENLKELRRMLGARNVTALRKEALQDTAEFWHATILPLHFQPQAHYRYQHDDRDPGYRAETKAEEGIGKGKSVDDVLSGQSERWMRVFYKISGTASRQTLSMRPPRYFTNPYIGVVRLPDGREATIGSQPDKPKEILTRHRDDDKAMTVFLQHRLQTLVDKAFSAGNSG